MPVNRQGRQVPEEIIFDAWTPMMFKRVIGDSRRPSATWMAPRWVGEHARRLQAYKVLRAYIDNASRYFLDTLDPDVIANRREYGDADLVVKRVVDAILGDDIKITVDGAEREDDELHDRALELQDYLLDWADQERFRLHTQEYEEDAVGLGDGVLAVTWSSEKGRAIVTTYDPGFYFPVLDLNAATTSYPRKIHIAWEEEMDRPGVVRVRRLTWELGFIVGVTDVDGYPVVGDDGLPLLRPGDARDAEGRVARLLPWNDEPTTETCYFTDATWELNVDSRNVEDLTLGKATYHYNEDGELLNRFDLGIDYIPVVHLPNTPSLREHYGRSTLATVLQILDDIQATDTDLSAASATTGSPPIVVSGATVETEDGRMKTYGPGTVIEVGGGKAEILDTSRSLDALLKYLEQLWERLSVNSQVPQSVLGRVTPSEVPSGVALALGFGPLESMIRKMRLIRDEKYSLIFKFVLRYAILNGDLAQGELPPARMRFGSFLPSDKESAVRHVQALLQNKAVSTLTALQILIDAGFPIDDAGQELERIRQEAEEAAEQQIEQMRAQAAIEQADPDRREGPPRPSNEQGSSPTRRGQSRETRRR